MLEPYGNAIVVLFYYIKTREDNTSIGENKNQSRYKETLASYFNEIFWGESYGHGFTSTLFVGTRVSICLFRHCPWLWFPASRLPPLLWLFLFLADAATTAKPRITSASLSSFMGTSLHESVDEGKPNTTKQKEQHTQKCTSSSSSLSLAADRESFFFCYWL